MRWRMGIPDSRLPTRRDYLGQLFSWKLLRESWDRAQSIVAAISLLVPHWLPSFRGCRCSVAGPGGGP